MTIIKKYHLVVVSFTGVVSGEFYMNCKIFKKFLFIISLVLFSSMIFVSCGEEKKSTETSSAVSKRDKIVVDYRVVKPSSSFNQDNKPSPLYVRFDGSVVKIEDVYKEPSSPITINPAINGKWIWEEEDVLRFDPSENWSLGTKYKVTMPSSIFSDQVSIESQFTFTTTELLVDILSSEFNINPSNPNEKRAAFTIKASYPLNYEKFSEDAILLNMTYFDSKGKTTKTEKINYSYSFNKDYTEIYIVSENIAVPPYTSIMTITVKKELEAQSGGKNKKEITNSLEIPGMSDYVRINDIKTTLVKNNQQSYDQMIVIETKGSISVDELKDHIKVYELPVDRPALQGWKEAKNFRWSKEYVVQEVLDASKEIEVTPIPTAEPASSINSFKFSGTPGRYLAIEISGDLQFFGGYKLSFENGLYESVQRVPFYEKQLGIMTEGTLLTLSGSKKLSL